MYNSFILWIILQYIRVVVVVVDQRLGSMSIEGLDCFHFLTLRWHTTSSSTTQHAVSQIKAESGERSVLTLSVSLLTTLLCLISITDLCNK